MTWRHHLTAAPWGHPHQASLPGRVLRTTAIQCRSST